MQNKGTMDLDLNPELLNHNHCMAWGGWSLKDRVGRRKEGIKLYSNQAFFIKKNFFFFFFFSFLS